MKPLRVLNEEHDRLRTYHKQLTMNFEGEDSFDFLRRGRLLNEVEGQITILIKLIEIFERGRVK